ncbi:hypothetical protein BOX15_Mlig023975g1 [Macrostomum lignano]|uniref:Cytochrome P450 n=1 Tax=Macrostomum lignano TaxID=282301 RepID=A0A267GG76_9PLAT|nr:hypothetical protein BOX15_Mlig023975g1 [Macrostomum lignano]
MNEFLQNQLTSRNALIGAGALAAAYTLRSLYRSSQLPPGPLGLPLLGRLPWLDTDHFNESEEAMRQKYGPIYSFRAGQRLMIVVSSYEMLKEMLKDDMFSGRLWPPQAAELSDGCGIIFSEGKTWSEQRRVGLRMLREFGFGKNESLALINEEVAAILASIESCNSEVDSSRLFSDLANGVIAMLVFGKRYANENPNYESFLINAKRLLNDSLASSLTLLFPTFAPLLKRLSITQQASTATLAMHQFFQEEIKKKEAELTDPNAEPLCICDAYIQERRRYEAKGDFYTHRPFHLVRICMEMFIAGTDTTSKSMEWLLAHMCLYPQVQAKVQQELDEVVGRERRPQINDRPQLHYMQAVIDESLRYASLAFNSLTHRAMKDTTFRGYRIPADAIIVPFVYGAHRDASIWEKPDQFYPEHFLDCEGKYSPSKYLIPFSIGRRICPGESLARLEIYMAFAAIMQKYSVTLAASCKDKAADVERGLTTTPRQPGWHKLHFVKR